MIILGVSKFYIVFIFYIVLIMRPEAWIYDGIASEIPN